MTRLSEKERLKYILIFMVNKLQEFDGWQKLTSRHRMEPEISL